MKLDEPGVWGNQRWQSGLRAEKDCLKSCWESASTRNELRMKSCQVYVTRLEKLRQVACGVWRVWRFATCELRVVDLTNCCKNLITCK